MKRLLVLLAMLLFGLPLLAQTATPVPAPENRRVERRERRQHRHHVRRVRRRHRRHQGA